MSDGLARARAQEPREPSSRWQQRLRVDFEYPVIFTRTMFSPGNRALAEVISRPSATRRPRMFAVVDAGVAAAWPELDEDVAAYARAHELELAADPWRLIGGEAAKNDPALISALHAEFFAAGLDRHCVVLIVGGGAVLDAAGYAAAVCHRGLRVVRAPTTVLAQNDAGVGVKNGVNAFGVKNALGTFAPPLAVINDLDFLATLPRRDRLAGLAEALKVALIRDPEFVDWLRAHAPALVAGEDEATAHAIQRCAELHLTHIRDGGDPFETGSARPLDFGHWAAHKLEVLSGHELRHGEAVAIGLAIDVRYSALAGLLEPARADAIDELIAALGLPLWHPALEQPRAVLAGLEDFREHLGGELTITLLAGVGRSLEVHAIDDERMLAAIAHLAQRQS